MLSNAQIDLFNQYENFQSQDIEKISGLQYVESYLTIKEHNDLIQMIDSAEWINDLSRRVQHYGFRYDYKARRIDLSMRIGKLPFWAEVIAYDLFKKGFFDSIPDQVIVNEYLPGQGITPHIDCEPCFDGTLVSISLGSDCIMDFTNPMTHEKIPLLLADRSMVILKGDSRYIWKHGIAPRLTDKYHGLVYKRKRRVSLTFRKTIIAP
ncbi:alpha-ketoglutarate-dependent dioxygenase AlkB [Chitinophaga ginsengisoli]|uniref:Alkylated DNA repair dioxygenase AlkB n=1 Tax=Chitinophaga ginsengisoli TaxID=363837 RepID=A0A2P8FPS3_9BACT|nr:alpha-ketoglutarate-dependent dioxygenase AlkB [Chitinophaga ginsengisoli]PSL23714.1 alkylated DNA repair dioxygenase AlkB [Chitinophaga ginsengisoli]